MKKAKAWDMIGWDDGKFVLAGGRTKYDYVGYNAGKNGRMVKLAYLKMPEKQELGKSLTHGIRQISRFVEPDTVLYFEDDKAFNAYCEENNIDPEIK